MTGKRSDYITWDEYFMGVALLSGRRSKDPSTQVGACIVSQDNKILSIKTIVFREDKYADTPAVRASKRMLNAAGVRYYQYQPTGRKIEIEV